MIISYNNPRHFSVMPCPHDGTQEPPGRKVPGFFFGIKGGSGVAPLEARHKYQAPPGPGETRAAPRQSAVRNRRMRGGHLPDACRDGSAKTDAPPLAVASDAETPRGWRHKHSETPPEPPAFFVGFSRRTHAEQSVFALGESW